MTLTDHRPILRGAPVIQDHGLIGIVLGSALLEVDIVTMQRYRPLVEHDGE